MTASSILSSFTVLLLFIAKSSSLNISARSQSYCYEEEDYSCGPESPLWPELCKHGRYQSPMNIIPPEYCSFLAYLPLHDFSADHFFLRNTGQIVEVDFTPIASGSRIFPGYGLTDKQYIFSYANFHWGPTDVIGSEHELNGRHFSMETHLVHYNVKFKTLDEALKSSDPHALGVYCVFFQVDPNAPPNPALGPIILTMSQLREPSPLWIKGGVPLDFTPIVRLGCGGTVYNFQGSLTEPPCDEIVDWYVVKDPLIISHSDVEAFRGTLNLNGQPQTRTYRPLNPSYDREVESISLFCDW